MPPVDMDELKVKRMLKDSGISNICDIMQQTARFTSPDCHRLHWNNSLTGLQLRFRLEGTTPRVQTCKGTTAEEDAIDGFDAKAVENGKAAALAHAFKVRLVTCLPPFNGCLQL